VVLLKGAAGNGFAWRGQLWTCATRSTLTDPSTTTLFNWRRSERSGSGPWRRHHPRGT
jgi:hypothetical protein